MPTAIAYIFSDEGLVIAADGLNTGRRTKWSRDRIAMRTEDLRHLRQKPTGLMLLHWDGYAFQRDRRNGL